MKKSRSFPLKELLKKRYPWLSEKEIFARIICGEAIVEGEKIILPNTRFDEDSLLEFRKKRKFVSRGGQKLAHVMDIWNIEIKGKTYLDAGCGTGGFTDCLLQNGASLVYSVDVGYNRLDYNLRYNPHVKVFERTNIMQIDNTSFNGALPDAAVVDLSFRSIRGAVSHILKIVKKGLVVSLVKPQFEIINPPLDFNGVIKSKKVLFTTLRNIVDCLWKEKSYISKVALSPIRGRKGNIEFFFLIKKFEETDKELILTELESLVYK